VTNLIEDLKKLNSKVEDIARAIQHEQELISQLEDRKREVEKEEQPEIRDLLNQIEENKRKLRDLEYAEKDIVTRKKDLEQAYQQEKIGKLEESLLELTDKRDRIMNILIPRMEEKVETLKGKVSELDAEILRINGKIQFLSGK
jgi:chromosome segregation ATPase